MSVCVYLHLYVRVYVCIYNTCLAQIKFTLTSGAKVKCTAPSKPFSFSSSSFSCCSWTAVSWSDMLKVLQADPRPEEPKREKGEKLAAANVVKSFTKFIMPWQRLVLSIFQVQRQKDFQFQIRERERELYKQSELLADHLHIPPHPTTAAHGAFHYEAFVPRKAF